MCGGCKVHFKKIQHFIWAAIICPRWTWSKMGAYRLGLIFPCVRLSIRRHISDMFGLILFKHGTSTVCTGRCTRAPHFMLWSHERWPTGKLVAILVGKPPVLNTSSTVSQTCIHRHCSTFLSYLYREASFMKMKNINSDETTRFNFTPTTFTNNLQKLIRQHFQLNYNFQLSAVIYFILYINKYY